MFQAFYFNQINTNFPNPRELNQGYLTLWLSKQRKVNYIASVTWERIAKGDV